MTDAAIVIGGGPNGLAAAIRLAEAGRTVTVLEAAGRPGGAVQTDELTLPGFRHDRFGSSHVWLHANPHFREFLPELQRYGLEYLWSEGAITGHPTLNGPGIVIYKDVDRTCASIAQYSSADARRYREIYDGFLDIREELINNRVDTEDRKNRLKEQIAEPLNKTCAEEFPLLDQRLAAAETLLREGGVSVAKDKAAPLADEAIDQANRVLTQLEEVLAKMQDLETYNELLEIVRDLLKDQEKLIERTQQERKRQTLEELK